MATITVTNGNDSGSGSLRAALAAASAGDTINFASGLTTINLASSLVISKNVTIEGAQTGSTTPGVTINGGGSGSNFSDFTVDAGITATIDGLILANGNATGAPGAAGSNYGSRTGSQGSGSAGGIYDAGNLTLTDTVLEDDRATGGAGGHGFITNYGGGGGGSAAGGIYVASTGTLNLATSDHFSGDTAVGGVGGQGGEGEYLKPGSGIPTYTPGGAGGAGGTAGVNGGVGAAGQNGSGLAAGTGGLPGQAGGQGGNFGYGAGGGGGGGSAFADVGGKGTINGPVVDLVTNAGNDANAEGSLLYELAHASAGDIIEFASNVTTIDLTASLVIDKNIKIEGAQAGSSTPGVTINGGGSSSNFSDFTIDAGVTASIDGLIIANGNAKGAAGAAGSNYGSRTGGQGGGAAGGIYDAGNLTLTDTVLKNDTATGGAGGHGFITNYGGGGGGNATGGIYVAATGTLNLATSDSFSGDSAVGGTGGQGGEGEYLPPGSGIPTYFPGGVGGAGGTAGVNGGAGGAGQSGSGLAAGTGGLPGQAGGQGGNLGYGAGGGGGGGSAFADVGGTGTINGPVIDLVTNSSDNINAAGSLRYELAHASAGDIIEFASNVTTINLASSLVISKNITIEGAQGGTPGVTINGGGSGSNFSDFTIDSGVTASIDGLIIAGGNAKGAAGAYGGDYSSSTGGSGGAAAGGIYDAGTLTLTNSVLENNNATGGAGGTGFNSDGFGGGAGGSAAGGIYVAGTGTLNLSTSDQFSGDNAFGGAGGSGGTNAASGGAGGAGGIAGVNGGNGSSGQAGELLIESSPVTAVANGGGAGGAPGASGGYGGFSGAAVNGTNYQSIGGGGGGGGGSAFAEVGGKGIINGPVIDLVTSSSGNVNTVGSLRYELAHASAGDTIEFASSVIRVDLQSSLVIDKNITIEGAQAGSGTPGVAIVGGGSGSNFSDFTIDAGVTASIDGLIIADGNAKGAAGAYGGDYSTTGGSGSAAAGGIYDAGTLTLTNSVLENDTAAGGAGGTGFNADGFGGGAGGSAAGGIYVASTGTLNLSTSDQFSGDNAFGGAGGSGGTNAASGGAGGAGGIAGVNGGSGSSGQAGELLIESSPVTAVANGGGAGGAPGEAGGYGGFSGAAVNGVSYESIGGGGGGGGGNAFADVGGKGTVNGPVPCYCPGTRIRTARGETRVEKLKIGDKVKTASGALRPIKWIGRRSYAGRFVAGNKDILPICIRAGALDDTVPVRDLWVSPHHALYLDGVLIEAKDLVNGVSIVQAASADTVEYFHVELDSHDVIVAEGALAESYIDDDNRGMFHNAPDYHARYRDIGGLPARYCAPRLEDGYEVERARQRIASRAGLLRAAIAWAAAEAKAG